jgi:putative flippase GtrA
MAATDSFVIVRDFVFDSAGTELSFSIVKRSLAFRLSAALGVVMLSVRAFANDG